MTVIDEKALWDAAVDLLNRHMAVYAPAGPLPSQTTRERVLDGLEGAQAPEKRFSTLSSSSKSVHIVSDEDKAA